MIWGLLYAKEMTFRERMAQLQLSVTSPTVQRGRMRAWRTQVAMATNEVIRKAVGRKAYRYSLGNGNGT